MQWYNFLLHLDPLDTLFLNDDISQLDNSLQNSNIIINNDDYNNDNKLIDYDLNSNISINNNNNDLIIDSPLSSISTNNSINNLEIFDNITANNNIDNNFIYNYNNIEYNNDKTINITELTNSNINLLNNNNNNNNNSLVLNKSLVLKSQNPKTFSNINNIIRESEISEDFDDINDDLINEIEHSETETINTKLNNNDNDNDNNNKVKKISDSRLSLSQLSIVLNLKGNETETAKREKNILKILKDDLNFPIGEKTWIRDTPINERERLLNDLTLKVEEIHHYGYSKKTLSIIVRRASYYMMQGRLRRERRLQRRKKNLTNKPTN